MKTILMIFIFSLNAHSLGQKPVTQPPPPPPPSAEAPEVPPVVEPPPPPSSPPPNLPLPRRYLLIGDSHTVGCFGKKMNTRLRQLADVEVYGTCGSSSASWNRTNGHSTTCGYRSCLNSESCTVRGSGVTVTVPSINTLLQNSEAGAVIVELGTNMLPSVAASKTSPSLNEAGVAQVMTSVKSLIAKIKAGGQKCFWVGPPQTRSGVIISSQALQSFNQRLKSQVQSLNCQYIDSLNKTEVSGLSSDGIHLRCSQQEQQSPGDVWAEAAFQEIVDR